MQLAAGSRSRWWQSRWTVLRFSMRALGGVSGGARASLAALCVCALSCSAPQGGESAYAASGASGTPDAGPSQPAARQHDPGCVAPDGVSNAPQSIADTVALMNALPKPLTLPCFLQALARPLEINSTDSLFSAQPAQGKRSPRIFLFRDPNTMSIVPAGSGAPLLEFGEQRPNYRSLKAQITFPVLGPLDPTAPFQDLAYNDQLTTCGLCHASEVEESTVSGVREFVSESFRPLASDFVAAADLANELSICDRAAEPDRCAMLDGLMGWGAVTDRAFPPEMATFGGN